MRCRWKRFEKAFATALLTLCLGLLAIGGNLGAEEGWQAGVGKREITPSEPVRLSGYANRSQPFLAVDDPLFVRALAMRHGSSPWSVIVSIDCIGLSAELSDRIHRVLRERHQIERHQVVLCCTHSHTTPHLQGGLINLFTEELSGDETAAVARYSDFLVAQTLEAIDLAFQQTLPVQIEMGEGSAAFAINRRQLKNGNWTGFGKADGGPVDQTVRVLRVQKESGEPLGVVYQYACHCTSISPELNRVSGDWAGISARLLESQLPGAIALPIVGCGADANPHPRGTYELATQHGTELSQSVLGVLQQKLKPLPPMDHTSFSYVALAYERPTEEQLQTLEKNEQPQQKRFAASMRAVMQRMGRIPETYPAPIHLWRFGNELTWVFMGGEVVVDYQIRMPAEFPHAKRVWVAAYTDDVFAYVASERVRREGGYEVDGSMLYYNRPGRWESGTEEFLVGRIRELEKQLRDPALPLSPEQALSQLQVADGFQVEEVACEPMVCDPVNVAFDSRGRAWVVEMGDYPSGGGHGGRIRILEDTDHDGRFDVSKVFLDKLDYPAGVFPWKDGAIIACSPEVFWARDTDGDDRADEKKVLISGFAMGNPQHRVHGFTYGLDHRLHFGVGMEVRGVKTASGQTLNVIGADLSLDVEKGHAQLETGPSQFIRSQDDWGNWFGNDNMHPLFQYVIERRYFEGNERFTGSALQQIYQPATAPIVYPIQRDADRFNDLFTANRFTSACSGILSRNRTLGEAMLGATLVCEPVHNLVSRAKLNPTGSSYRAQRFEADQASEWLRSQDAWFRPVRVENAPDGTLWVLDMYRRVIEHPEWIPEDWQARIDVRAGEGLGRIYRVFPIGQTPKIVPDMSKAQLPDLIKWLGDDDAATRELAQRQLIFLSPPESKALLLTTLKTHTNALARLHAMAVLRATGWLDASMLQQAMGDSDPRVARMAIRWSEELNGDWKAAYAQAALSSAARQSSPLAMQLVLTSGRQGISQNIGSLLLAHPNDHWLMQAARLQKPELIDGYLQELLASQTAASHDLETLLVDLLPGATPALQGRLLETLKESQSERPAWHFVLAAALRDQRGTTLDSDAYRRILIEASRCVLLDTHTIPLREAALRLLVSESDPKHQEQNELFLKLVADVKNEKLGVLALDGLRRTKDSQVAKTLIGHWQDLGPHCRANLIHYLVTERPWVVELIEALEQKRLVYSDLDPIAIEHLSRIPDASLRERSSKVLESGKSDPSALIVEYLAKMPTNGDTVKGKTVFERQCAICHRDRGELTAVGPNLASLKEWTDQAWLTAILDPNRSVEARYRRTMVATDDGNIHVGIMLSETEDWIDLALADGNRERIMKAEIENLRESNQSLMPEGFGTFLTPTDLRHLLEFLRTAPDEHSTSP